ncbi:MAG: hypothetical protein CL878_15145 [Dehalococcoidia bacterium]|nr:hypothetical protein [Dehalococcoidia bacterium]
MRILFGPTNREPCAVAGHELLTFGGERSTVQFSQAHESWDTLLERAQAAAGKADVVVWWLPEDDPFPDGGPSASPVPVVAMVSDWNLSFHSVTTIARRCALTLVDRAGAAVLQRRGITRVLPWRIYGYGFDSAVHQLRPVSPRTVDLLFVGNLNPAIHAERAHWLRRIAGMAGEYRVRVRGGVFGEAYWTALAQSRIVFNHSVRGEMNVRCYEATALGALLFIESSNLEVGEVLRDGRECVRYDEHTFEALARYYLDHEDERERVAMAGRERIQQERPERRWAILADTLDRLQEAGNLQWPASASKTVASALSSDRGQAHAAINAARSGHLAIACRTAQALAADHPGDVKASATLALAAAHQAADTDLAVEDRDRWRTLAWSLLRRVVQADGQAALAGRALANLSLEKRDSDSAIRWFGWVQAAASHQDGPSDLDLPLYPRLYDDFRSQWERATARNDPADLALLLCWDCALRLGQLARTAGNLTEAIGQFSRAIRSRPDLSEPYFERSDCRHEQGQAALAADDEQQGHGCHPLKLSRWPTLARRLMAAGRADEAKRFCRESLDALGAFERVEGVAAALESVLADVDR